MGKERDIITLKYKAGDTVWYMNQNEICSAKIERLQSIIYEKRNGHYVIHWNTDMKDAMSQEILFSSKIDLLNHLTGSEL